LRRDEARAKGAPLNAGRIDMARKVATSTQRDAARAANLRRAFSPRSIAVVGASDSPGKAGWALMETLADFAGEIFPINPKAAEIRGRKAYKDLAAIGAPVDLVIMAVPPQACVDAFAEAAGLDVAGALICSGGFAETGGDGPARQAALEAILAKSTIRLFGPNTAGFLNLHDKVKATFVADLDHLAAGDVAIVSASSGMNLTFAWLLQRRASGPSYSVGVGNAVDVDVADVLDHLVEDRRTRAIVLHLEGLGDGRALYEALARTTPRTPVVALVGGRGGASAFAQSHTGRLLGSHERKIAMLRQAGAIVAETSDEAADAAVLLSKLRLMPKADVGVGIVTGQAGPGLLAADLLDERGVRLPKLAPASVEIIKKHLPLDLYTDNPVDTARPGPGFLEVVEAVAKDPGVDLICVWALHEGVAMDPRVALMPAKAVVPVLFGTLGEQRLIAPLAKEIEALGVPVLHSPEQLARAAAILAADARAQARLGRPRPAAGEAKPALSGAFDEATAKDLIESYGVPATKRKVCTTRAEAEAAFKALGAPVVVKVLSSEIAHKTEAGGVIVGVKTKDDLAAALDKIDAIKTKGAQAYLVEAMAGPGIELIVGAVRDETFGPIVMLGLGGVAAEALKDTTSRLAPLTPEDALEMAGELKAQALLDGFRGAPSVDRAALAEILVNLGRLLTEHPEIAEVEINPLRATARGLVALDALVVMGSN
jgi:acetyltransferase